jgi:intracellular multiplication protein IcmP
MGDKKKQDPLILGFFAAVAVILFCVIYWLLLQQQISSGIRWLRVAEIYIINLFTDDYRPLQQQLMQIHPSAIQPIHLMQMTEAVNGFFRIPIIVIFAAMATFSAFKKYKHPYTRKFTIEQLVQEQASVFNVTKPMTKFNPLDTSYRTHGSPVPEKLPLFAEALTADEWVTYCNIPVNDGDIDHDAARRAFAQQLGGRWKGVSGLPHFAQALFVAFSMKANGMRSESDVFLGEIANCWDPKFGLILTPKLKKEIQKKIKDPKFGRVTEKVAAQHAFNVPALLRCLQIARENGGVLAPAQFLWLRGINRHYWYALNNLGRGAVHIEAAGAIAHYRAEKSAGKPIINPIIDPAITGLENYLKENFIDRFPAKEYARG